MSYNDRQATMISTFDQLTAKQKTQKEVAKILDVTRQTVGRRHKRYLVQGRASLIHGNKGKESTRKIPSQTWQKINELLATKLKGMGPTHAAEKLDSLYGYKVSVESLRKYMHQNGFLVRRRKPRKPYRSKRPRRMYRGELVQMDGSYFPWFKHDPRLYCIIALIDDANSEITALWFCSNETSLDVMIALKLHIQHHGIPLAIYTDKHSTYRMIDRAAAERGELCSFQKACKKLGIENIYANTPQAKGRVERLFEFLQGRLPHEMDLLGIVNVQQANDRIKELLPILNARYAKKPLFDEHKARPMLGIPLAEILALNEARVLQNDWTLSYEGTQYQVLKEQLIRLRPKDLITVRTYLDKTIKFFFKNTQVSAVPITEFRPEPRPIRLTKHMRQLTTLLHTDSKLVHPETRM